MERHPESWILRWHPVFQTCFQEKGAESDESDVEKGAICTPLHQLVAGCFRHFFVHLYDSLYTSPMLERGTTLNSKEVRTLKLQRRVGKFSLLFSMVQHWRDTFCTILSNGCWSWRVFFPNSPNSCSLSCLSCCLNLPTLTNFSFHLWGNVLDKYGFWLQSLTTCAGSPSTFPGKYAGGPALPFLDFRIRKMKHWNWKHYILVRC